MTLLLDTNTCVYYLNGRKAVVERLHAAIPEAVAISAVTLAELRFGADKSGRPEANHQRIEVFKAELMVLPFDEELATEFGRLKAILQRAGSPIPDFDIAIAVTALMFNMTLVSSDKHMRHVPGLRMEGWA